MLIYRIFNNCIVKFTLLNKINIKIKIYISIDINKLIFFKFVSCK